ncbi:MAG: hypothetical protein II887_08245 [Bacteroidales bacterium]|nr:hypothetical protein [Bacteroidales bacterium]
MKKTLVIFLIIMVLSCCTKTHSTKDDFFTIQKTPYIGDKLRIDGFFYQKWDNGAKYLNITFFYKNGVVFQGNSAGHMSDLVEQAQQTLLNHDQKKNIKSFWGLFQVDDNKIIYERWEGSQLGYLVYREEGVIINDTTFVMTEISRVNQGVKTEIKPIERMYYFKEFSPKPDSTNVFIP